MKTDAERQTEYQNRRRATEDRITMWVPKEMVRGMDTLRGNESRTDWLNRAITELTIRQLLGRPFPFSDEEYEEARLRGLARGIELPNS